MFRLAIRNIFRNGTRTALTLLAIAAGVASIILSGGFVEDIFHQLREATIHSRIGHLQIHRAGFLESGRREPSKYLIEDTAALVDEVSRVPAVEDVMARLEFSGLANNGQADLPIVGEGIEPAKEARLGSAISVIDGRQLKPEDYAAVVIGEGVAAALELAPGDHITILANTFEGALNTMDAEVVGIFRTFFKDFDDRAIRVPLAAAQDLLFTQASHALIVSLKRTEDTDTVLQQLRKQLGPKGYEISPWYVLADFYEKTVALYKRQFGALQAIILIMLVLSVASTVNMAVFERTGEFGTLMAIGVKRGNLARQIVLEYALMGLIGGLTGLAIGIALAALLSHVGIEMPPPPGSNASYTASIRLTPSLLIVAPAIGSVAAALAAIVPARKASRTPVVEALRHNV